MLDVYSGLTQQAATAEGESVKGPTPAGMISLSWKREEGRFIMDVTVPYQKPGELHVPLLQDNYSRLYFNRELIWADGRMVVKRKDIRYLGRSSGYLRFAVDNISHYRLTAE